jgi:hypothetical protein
MTKIEYLVHFAGLVRKGVDQCRTPHSCLPAKSRNVAVVCALSFCFLCACALQL